MHRWQKSRCKRLCVADTPPGKNKSPAPSADARQKKSPVRNDRVECFLFAGLKECTEKPERKENT